MAEIRRDVDTLKTDVIQLQQELKVLSEIVRRTSLSQQFIFIFLANIISQLITCILYIRTETKAPTEITVLDDSLMRDKPTEVTENKLKASDVSDTVNVKQCLEAVKNLEIKFEEALHDVTQRVDMLEKEVNSLIEKIDSVQITSSADDNGINELVTKIKDIQADMERLGETADKLLEDKESREAHLNVRAFNSKIR